jgi:hypothetical protein
LRLGGERVGAAVRELRFAGVYSINCREQLAACIKCDG